MRLFLDARTRASRWGPRLVTRQVYNPRLNIAVGTVARRRKEVFMAKVFFAVFAVFLVLGGLAAVDFRGKMSSARLGSDVTYTLDSRGNAAVEMVNKSFFTDGSTEKNFDEMAARLGQPDVAAYRKGVEESLKNISDKAGRQFTVSDFEGSFERRPEYGAQVFRFRWTGFAEQRGADWVVDFKTAKAMKLTKDSSLVIVLPTGASLVKAEPAPTGGDARRLVWTGNGEMPWPYVEYK